MKITIESTDRISKSDYGVGRVWEGTTDQGTPVKALVAGLAAGSDDPVLEAQFDREHAALTDVPDTCPDCGEPLVEHAVVEQGQLVIDLYDVAARMLETFGEGRVEKPEGVTPERLAKMLREQLPKVDKDYHDRLLRTASEMTQFIVMKFMEGQGITRLDAFEQATVKDVGHA